MKPIIMRLYGTALFIFFPILFFLRKKIKGRIIIILMTVVILSGCFQHYFRTHTQTKADEATIQQLMSINKYFIIIVFLTRYFSQVNPDGKFFT